MYIIISSNTQALLKMDIEMISLTVRWWKKNVLNILFKIWINWIEWITTTSSIYFTGWQCFVNSLKKMYVNKVNTFQNGVNLTFFYIKVWVSSIPEFIIILFYHFIFLWIFFSWFVSVEALLFCKIFFLNLLLVFSINF